MCWTEREEETAGERREGEGERGKGRQTAVKQADPGSFLLVLFLLLLSVRPAVCSSSLSFVAFLCTRVLPCRGPCRVKTTYARLARPPAVGLLPRGLCPLLFSSTRRYFRLSCSCSFLLSLFFSLSYSAKSSFPSKCSLFFVLVDCNKALLLLLLFFFFFFFFFCLSLHIDLRSSQAAEFSYAAPSRRNR